MSHNLKRVLPVSVFFIILSFAFCIMAEASVYMPNRIHDEYTYKDSNGNQKTAECDSPFWFIWHHWTEFAGFGSTWVYTSLLNERVYIYANDSIQLLVNFNSPVGSQWLIDAGACNQEVYASLGAINQEVKVAAGIFKKCIRVDLESSCADGGVMAVWFAPNVGVVKWESQSIAGPVTTELVKGKIGGITYPKPVPITLSVKGGTDRFEYFIDLMPSPDPSREPVLLYGEFSINNSGEESFDFVFEACEFDINIYDDEGNMVSHMNRADSSCDQEIALENAVKKTLKKGDIWVYKGQVELTDDKGNDLPEGDYKVECLLKATPRFSSSQTIRITYTY